MSKKLGNDGKTYLIDPSGKLKVSKPKGKYFTLQEMYSMIDCRTIEMARSKHKGYLLIFDEEYRLKEGWYDDMNIKATQCLHESFRPMQTNILSGKVLLVKNNQIK
tara:strand:- start:1388 stop:1705 length:318 start_codon:yes stop_codon:yes gene_type:complete